MCPKESNEASFLMKAASAASVLVAVFFNYFKGCGFGGDRFAGHVVKPD